MKDLDPKSLRANRYSATTRPPSFEQAEVPAHLLKLEVDTLPANRAFYLESESEKAWDDSATMAVDKRTGTLYLDGSTEIDSGSDRPTTPLGLVGVMRVETIGEGGNVLSFFVADLRFIDNHELSVIDDMDDAPTDQEEFNRWSEFKKDLREVVAFVAPIPDTEASKRSAIPALYYGPEEYYGALDALRERGDKLLAKTVKKQRQANKLAKAATHRTKLPKHRHRFFNRKE